MTPADLDAIERDLRDVYLAPGIADAFAKLRKERNQWEDCAALYMADRDRLLIALREFMDVCAYAERDVLKAGISRAYNMGRAALAAGQHYQPTTTNAHAALTATEAAK